QLRLRGAVGCARFEATEYAKEDIQSSGRRGRRRAPVDPKRTIRVRLSDEPRARWEHEAELGTRDTDNRCRRVEDLDCLSDDGGVAAEMTLPKRVAENRHRRQLIGGLLWRRRLAIQRGRT